VKNQAIIFAAMALVIWASIPAITLLSILPVIENTTVNFSTTLAQMVIADRILEPERQLAYARSFSLESPF
jgi:hypothetical protein